ncbi:MAG: prepilin-type N-terminal cleavage/methylation domain-containing protein [Desulfamplus sp.]|nr:prepilin-type N-terminal cleavage/methylation domain-containing protein [Desulfamplus sp.]
MNHKIEGFTLIELMIVISIIGILAAIGIPNFISYRNKAFCTMAETDANHIEMAIVSYFGNPNHIAIAKADLNYSSSQNTFSIAASAPNIAITITVTDVSGRCPTEYRNAMALNAKGNGWNGNVYQKVIGR